MKALHRAILDEILEERVVSSRGRHNSRGVKRKMTNYPIRHPLRAPTFKIDYAQCIQVLK